MLNKEKIGKIARVTLVPLTLVAFYLYLYFVEGVGKMGDVLRSLRWRWLVVAALVWCASAVFYDASLFFVRRHYQRRFPIWSVPLNSRKASFYEMLTPGTFAFGPVTQVRNMSAQGVPVSNGVAIMLLQQTCSVISYIATSLALVAANFRFFADGMTLYMWFFYVAALVMAALIMLFYMLVPRFDGPIVSAANLVIRFLAFIRIARKDKKEGLMEKARSHIMKLRDDMRSLNFSRWEWTRSVLLLSGEKLCLNSIQFFVAMSLGVDVRGMFPVMVAAQSMITVISNQVAIPGGFGIVEVCYHVFMMPIIKSESSLNFMMLLSRIVTYYFPLLVGGATVMIRPPVGNQSHSDNGDERESGMRAGSSDDSLPDGAMSGSIGVSEGFRHG